MPIGVLDERTMEAMPMFLATVAFAVGEFMDEMEDSDREGIVYLRNELIKDGVFDIQKTLNLLQDETNHTAVVSALKEVLNFNFNMRDTNMDIEFEDRIEFDCVWCAICAFNLF